MPQEKSIPFDPATNRSIRKPSLQSLEPRLLFSSLQTLASFNGLDGAHPLAGLVRSGDLLYGTTADGGAYGDGEVFSLPLAGGTPRVLASFNGADGSHPLAGLTIYGDRLYGTTSQGGAANGDGTVFSLSLDGGTPDVLASFEGSDGQKPAGGLVASGDLLYGTTQYGGPTNGDGTVFSIPLNGGPVRLIAAFDGADGADPYGDLIVSGATLLGTVAGGGVAGDGGVFVVSIDGGTPELLTSSSGAAANGHSSQGAGLISSGDVLYGTTIDGGTNGAGDVFSIPASGGTPTILASFDGADGAEPSAGLILYGSALYGTTQNGGASGDGTIFAINLSTGSSDTSVTTAVKKKAVVKHSAKTEPKSNVKHKTVVSRFS